MRSSGCRGWRGRRSRGPPTGDRPAADPLVDADGEALVQLQPRVAVARRRASGYPDHHPARASMALSGMGPSLAVEGATTSAVFEAYVEEVLALSLRSG
jgi:hypothetical protein